jgi:hypothetical protein
MAAKKKTRAVIDHELRKWCIDEAMRWPVITESYGGGMSMGMGRSSDADVIGRAQQIENWILGK